MVKRAAVEKHSVVSVVMCDSCAGWVGCVHVRSSLPFGPGLNSGFSAIGGLAGTRNDGIT